MMPPAKQMDPVTGVDIHLIAPPPPAPPAPIPVPHPFVGMIFDLVEWAPFIGATVKAHGTPAAIAGATCKAIPPHIPMGGMWVPPLPANEGEMFMGSSTVAFDGDAASHLMHPALTCQSVGMPQPPRFNKKKKPKTRTTLMLPTSFVMPIPGVPPVFIGGPPTISLMALGMKVVMAGLGKAFKKLMSSNLAKKLGKKFKKARQKAFKKMKPGFLKCTILKAEPVNGITGEVVVEQEDFTIDGHIPLEWTRCYGSQSEYEGYCGKGWQTPADIRLVIDDEDQALFYDGGPGATVFPYVPDDPYSSKQKKENRRLPNSCMEVINGSELFHEKGRLFVKTKEGQIYRFEKPQVPLWSRRAKPLTLLIDEIGDEYDNHLRFIKDENGTLIEVRESTGRAIVVSTYDGLITRLQLRHPDDSSRLRPLLRFQYDNDRNLVSVFDALNVPYRFFYKNEKLVQHKVRNGLSFYYEYDGPHKEAKCIHAYGDHGLYDYHFEYKPNLTSYKDSLGNEKSLQYDANNLPFLEFDSLGVLAKYEYDENGHTTAVVDAAGGRTEYEYDERGNLLKLIRPDRTSLAIEYDDDSNPTRVTDPNGNIWRQEWNDRHRLQKQRTPLGNESNYAYDPHGELESGQSIPTKRINSESFGKYEFRSMHTDCYALRKKRLTSILFKPWICYILY